MIPEKAQEMDKDYLDVTISSLIALLAGWLVKGVFSASKREVEQLRQEMRHLVTTRAFDKELNGLQARLDRIEEKLDKIITER